MKQLLYVFFFLQFSAFAQCDTSNIVRFPDVDAQFPGGIAEMKRYIAENIDYLPIKQYVCFPDIGPMYFQFIVCEDGSIRNVRLIRPSNSEYVPIAQKMIEEMPNWIPGEMNDRPVASWIRLPIRIELF